MISKTFWQIQVTSTLVSGKAASGGYGAIVDSGTTPICVTSSNLSISPGGLADERRSFRSCGSNDREANCEFPLLIPNLIILTLL